MYAMWKTLQVKKDLMHIILEAYVQSPRLNSLIHGLESLRSGDHHHMCVSRISLIIWPARCSACNQNKNKES